MLLDRISKKDIRQILRNIDVYPLIVDLLNMDQYPMVDGSLDSIKFILNSN